MLLRFSYAATALWAQAFKNLFVPPAIRFPDGQDLALGLIATFTNSTQDTFSCLQTVLGGALPIGEPSIEARDFSINASGGLALRLPLKLISPVAGKLFGYGCNHAEIVWDLRVLYFHLCAVELIRTPYKAASHL